MSLRFDAFGFKLYSPNKCISFIHSILCLLLHRHPLLLDHHHRLPYFRLAKLQQLRMRLFITNEAIILCSQNLIQSRSKEQFLISIFFVSAVKYFIRSGYAVFFICVELKLAHNARLWNQSRGLLDWKTDC